MKKTHAIPLIALIPTLAWAQSPPPGEWEDPFFFGDPPIDEIEATTMIHVFDGVTGKMLVHTRKFATSGCAFGLSRLWTPPPMGSPPGDPGVFETVPVDPCDTWMFCQGHSALADGRILHMGGGDQSDPQYDADLFYPENPATAPWNNPCPPPPLNFNRWYPTATTLPDGRILVSGGNKDDPAGEPVMVPELEIYDPNVECTPLHPFVGDWSVAPSSADRVFKQLYPYMFVLPDGNVLDASPNESRILDISTSTWGPPLPKPPPPEPRNSGSAVMYEPGKIVVCGGGPARKTTWVLDATDPNQQGWLVASEMNVGRRNHDLVVMPDGKILCIGGNTESATTGVLETEIFEPAAGNAAWTLQPDLDIERWYHSTAMLLQDGRVVAAGGDNKPTAQIFRPPYITSGAPRPIITDAPVYMQWGEAYTILYLKNGGPSATKACLTRLGSVTHGFDQDARRVPLTITGYNDGPQPDVTVAAPANGNIAPPGYYMLWILNEYANNRFAPCELAAYVQVGP